MAGKESTFGGMPNAARGSSSHYEQVTAMHEASSTGDLTERLRPAILTLRIIVVALAAGVVASCHCAGFGGEARSLMPGPGKRGSMTLFAVPKPASTRHRQNPELSAARFDWRSDS